MLIKAFSYNYDSQDLQFIKNLEEKTYIDSYEETLGTFNDYLIVPKFLEDAISRKQIDIKTEIYTIKGEKRGVIPIISSPMSFFGKKFGKELSKEFIYSVPRIGKNLEERIEILKEIKKNKESFVAFSFGYKEELPEEVLEHSDLLLLDIAHGASKQTVDYMFTLSKVGINSGLIVGNVGSKTGLMFLLYFAQKFDYKNIYIRAGIGSGSACTTRLKTGVGFPQLDLMKNLRSFLEELNNNFINSNLNVYLISDGGIKYPGDISKALIFSDLVMIGKLLSSKEMETYDEKTDSATYFGMASKYAKNSSNNIEGDKYTLKNLSGIEEVMKDIKESLQSSLSYVNAKNLLEFKRKAKLIKITSDSTRENFVG